MLSLHEDRRARAFAKLTVGEGQAQQVLLQGFGGNRSAVDLLVALYHPQVQAEIDQTQADAHPNEEVEAAGKGRTRAHQKESGEEGPNPIGQGTDRCQHLAED